MKPLHFLGLLTAAFILSEAMAAKLAFGAIVPVPANQACAPEDEMAQMLFNLGVEQIMGGTAGAKGDNLGEVWINPTTRFYVFVQRIPDAHVACVVLGGEQMTGKGRRT